MLFVALAVACAFLVVLAVPRQAAARRSERLLHTRLLRAQERWAEDMDRRYPMFGVTRRNSLRGKGRIFD
jgi:hypothetical protein